MSTEEPQSDQKRGPGQQESSRRPGPGGWGQSPQNTWIRVVLLAIIVFLILNTFGPEPLRGTDISYTRFRGHVESGLVTQVTLRGDKLAATLRRNVSISNQQRTVTYSNAVTFLPSYADEELADLFARHRVDVSALPEQDRSGLIIFLLLAPVLLLLLLGYLQYRRMQGSQGGLFSIGKNRARLYTRTEESTSFDDVAGAEGAKTDLQEVVEFLKTPDRIQKLGGSIPKGVLLTGAPGCGKTLLARAVAGEAEVPFFSITGSDFMEMFVGVGASRVRNLFKDAKKAAPCIIFIDELDSIGRRRGAGLGGGHDEREQTLNQLLSEMDGFEPNESVIVIAATNRPDILDTALTRPGRFDRRIAVDQPKVKDREAILAIHARRKELAETVDLHRLAQGTPGFSGADLENLLNEAALLAGRKRREQIEPEDIEAARDKILMGLERRGMALAEEERRMVAYHESGHAIVSAVLEYADPVHKVSIIPRSNAMGVTQRFPLREQYIYRREYMLDFLAVLLGGRAAEQAVFGTSTSGAAEDLRQATQIARRMVVEWGMSDRFGGLAWGSEQQQVFLGEQISQQRDYSEATAKEIDEAVQGLFDQARKRADTCLEERREELDRLADTLLEQEEISGTELLRILGLDPSEEDTPAVQPATSSS